MSLILATLGLGEYRRAAAGRKGGLTTHRRLCEQSDKKITTAIEKHGPMRAKEIAKATGYNGWSGIRSKLESMVRREILVKRDRTYYLDN